MKLLLGYILSKGTLIGFMMGALKIMQDVRRSTFKWKIAITDISSSTLMGYSVYSWAGESVMLSEWQVILLTVFFSLNTFVVLKIVTDPKTVKVLLNNWFKIKDNNNE